MAKLIAPGPLDFNEEATFHFKERVLDRQSFSVDFTLPPEAIRYNTDELFGEGLARVTAYVYGEDLGTRRVVLSQPATWWDHFKKDHMPEWFCERFPIKWHHQRYVFDAKALYPYYRPLNGYSQPRYVVREIGLEEYDDDEFDS